MADNQKSRKTDFSILVVDDEPANIDLLQGILSPYYQVKVAPTGHIALKVVEQFTPDLILLDIMMPGEDGLSLCRNLRAGKHRNTPVLMLTARNDETDRIIGLEMGADDYLPKPLSPRELLARIETREGDHLVFQHAFYLLCRVRSVALTVFPDIKAFRHCQGSPSRGGFLVHRRQQVLTGKQCGN